MTASASAPLRDVAATPIRRQLDRDDVIMRVGIALLIAFLIFILIGGVIVQWLWNWLMPDLFSLRRITWVEALGLLALSRILFGGFGRGGGGHHSGRRREWWKKKNGAASSAAQPAGGAS